jgi:hypothetical protein
MESDSQRSSDMLPQLRFSFDVNETLAVPRQREVAVAAHVLAVATVDGIGGAAAVAGGSEHGDEDLAARVDLRVGVDAVDEAEVHRETIPGVSVQAVGVGSHFESSMNPTDFIHHSDAFDVITTSPTALQTIMTRSGQ